MNKKLFWISMVLILLPELLWAPVFNFIFFMGLTPSYGIVQSFRNLPVSENFSKTLVIIQSIGVIVAIIQLLRLKSPKYLFLHRVAILALFILSIVFLYLLYYLFIFHWQNL